METYGSWTAEEIDETEGESEFVPPHVQVASLNGDSDQDVQYERLCDELEIP